MDRKMKLLQMGLRSPATMGGTIKKGVAHVKGEVLAIGTKVWTKEAKNLKGSIGRWQLGSTSTS